MTERTWVLALTPEGRVAGYGDDEAAALTHARHLANRANGEVVGDDEDYASALERWVASLTFEPLTIRHGNTLAKRIIELLPILLVLAPEHEICRECGCTAWGACPGGCSWADSDLCSECEGIREGEASE